MTTQSTLAIDRLLPDADVAAAHAIVITAPAAIVYQQAQALDLRRSWGVRQLFRLRGLPQSALTLEDLQRLRFALLVDDPPHEMVLGLVGRFWTPTGELRRTDPEDFRSFQESGFAKAAWNFSVTGSWDRAGNAPHRDQGAVPRRSEPSELQALLGRDQPLQRMDPHGGAPAHEDRG